MAKNKLSIDDVRKRIEERGGTLLSTEFNGYKIPLHILTSDGVEEYRTMSSIIQSTKLISKTKRNELTRKNQGFTIDDVRKIIKEKGGECLSDEYLNEKSKLLIRTSDGVEEYRSLKSIRTSNLLVSKAKRLELSQNICRFDEDFVREEIRKRGGELLSFDGYKNKHTSKVKLRTADGEIEERPLASIFLATNNVYSKKYNTLKKRKSIEEIRNKIESLGGKLVSKDYTGCRELLEIICSCGATTYNSIFNIDCNHKEKITCNKCRPSSNFEIEVFEYIKSLIDSDIIRNDRKIIHPYELDIAIPDKKIAIECNGVFWHSEQQGKDKKYHLQKYQKCASNNIRLMHISDYIWYAKSNIIKDIIKKSLGTTDNIIYGRKCVIKDVPYGVAVKFLTDNHLQGPSPHTYAYGLYYNNELVSIMTFSTARFTNKAEYELCRFCNKLGTSVIGGFSKLLKHFFKNINCKSLISYCDISYFSGNLYRDNGFTFSHRSSPNYKYFKINKTPLELYSRNKFQKHKQNKLLEKFDDSKSEYNNMLMNGFDRIWDCGNDVYIINS